MTNSNENNFGSSDYEDEEPDDRDAEETDLTEIFTPEEIEDLWNSNLLRPNPAMFSAFGYFPEEESYRRSLGKLLPHRIGRIISKFGFKTEVSKGQSNGVDLKVWYDNRLVLVAETKNYNIRTKLTDELIANTISNLNEHPYCARFFIFTQMANEKVLSQFQEEGIGVIKIGYQLLPEWFYYSIDPRYRSYRRIDSKDTSQDIKQKLYPVLHSLMDRNSDQPNVTIRL
jgi:hypothetical protein